jgi:hypothetical protein
VLGHGIIPFDSSRGSALSLKSLAIGRVILMLGVAPHCAIKGPDHR